MSQRWRRLACLVLWCVAATAAGCGGSSPVPGGGKDAAGGAARPDEAALHDQYVAMQEQAVKDVRAWKGPSDGPDPRLTWADRLQAFAREHTGTQPAAEALLGALVLRAGRGDIPGFFAAFDQALESMPDEPGLTEILPQVAMMRWAEAGGPGIVMDSDAEAGRGAYRRALPRIKADLERVLKVTSNPGTRAAAHYTLGMACHQLESDPRCALEHFTAVTTDHPDYAQVESARTFVRELETLAVGMPAPDFEVTLLDGRTTRLSDHRGRIVLVDFWATWCRPCVEQMPYLRSAWTRYRGQGFTVLGISLDTEIPTVRQFVDLHGIRWPVAASGLGMSDPVAATWSLQGIPMSYLVDREGIIRGRAVFGADIERAVGALTSAPAQR